MQDTGAVRVNVSLIGGEHHFLHVLPVAAWLSRQPGVRVRLFPRDRTDAAAAQEMMVQLGAGRFVVTHMSRNRLARIWHATFGNWGAKIAEIIGTEHAQRNADALLVTERTSALLTHLPGHQPMYIRFTHGVGDREKGFSKRARVFDHFIVAGKKYAERFVAEGIAPPEHISLSGYQKLAAIRVVKDGRGGRLFDNALPTVLYVPHFDLSVSSWEIDGRKVIDTILGTRRYNLILAPHIRLFANASVADREKWEALGQADPLLLVDLGSHALTDMTYLDAADIMVCEVTSQIYEFLAEPRPCVFLNSHHVAWRDDPAYLAWTLGQVVDDVAGALVPALDKAEELQAHYRPLQEREIAHTLGDLTGDPAERAGREVLRLIAERRAQGKR